MPCQAATCSCICLAFESLELAARPYYQAAPQAQRARRKGQNPKVRIGERADGKKYYFFQYWIDVPGQEERRRQTEVIGLVSQMVG